MRVLYLHQQPCIRTLKYAAGLRAVRPDIELAFAYRGRTLTEFYGQGDELFDHWWRLGDDLAGDLRQVLAAWEPDLVHSHNLPDALTVLALEVADVPVIHDVHDMHSLRSTPYEDGFPDPGDATALERAAVEGCHALITVSEPLLEELARRYALPAVTCIYPNYALARDLPPELPEARENGRPRVVYQGTLSRCGGHYDLREIFAEIAAQGVDLHVHPARDEPAYREIDGVTVHPTVPPAELMRRLPAYDFGWAGFNGTLNRAHLDTALPNKAFEYMGCGLPVITLEHKALAGLVQAEGVGLVLGSVGELAERLRTVDGAALRARVAAARERFTVEGNVGRIAGLYDAVRRPAPAPTGPPAL